MDGSQLRCGGNKLHGILEGKTIQIKCDSRFCGAGQGWAVYHTFDLTTGELVSTETFKNPPTAVKEDGRHDSTSNRTAVRHP